MVKKIIFSIGFSLVIGLVAGYLMREEKYYSLLPNSPKTEVTEEYAVGRSDMKYVRKETVYNFEKGLIIGLATLGCSLMIITFLKRS